MKNNHTHKAVSEITRAFSGSVSWEENRAAHGNICRIETCSCGAKRRTNINGRHTEVGPWRLAAAMATDTEGEI